MSQNSLGGRTNDTFGWRCSTCKNPDTHLYPKAPLQACMEARKHARRFKGHLVLVMNYSKLEEHKRYQIDMDPGLTDEPPF